MYHYSIDELVRLLGKHGYDTHQNKFWVAMLNAVPSFRAYLDKEMAGVEHAMERFEQANSSDYDECSVGNLGQSGSHVVKEEHRGACYFNGCCVCDGKGYK